MGKNVKRGALDLRSLERVTQAFHASQRKSQLAAGDVVVVRIGRSGEAAVVPDTLGEANCSGLVVFKRPWAVRPDFLAAYLNSPIGQRASLDEVRGVTRQTLNTGSVAAAMVPIPPLNEQRRIVAKLEALQSRSRRAREALDAVPPLLEKLRQSVLAAAFRGDLTKDWRAKNKGVEPASELLRRIRTERRKKWEEAELAKMKAKGKAPTDDKWKAKYKEPEPVDATGLPELPEGWCWASVEALLSSPEDLFDGPFGSALKSSDYTSSGVRVVRLENVANLEFRGDKETFVSPTKYESLARHSVRAGDIIFGSFVEESTRVCMLPELGGPAIAKADCFCVRPDAQVIRAEVMVFALGSHHARTELTRGIHGATRPRINTGQLRSLRVALPPRDEQPIILEKLEAALASLRRLGAAHGDWTAGLSSLERSVLAKAFRGELVPQDPSDEPAEAMLARVRGANGGATSEAKPKRGRKAAAQQREMVDD